LGYGWVFLEILGFGWVLGFFKILKKNWKFSGKIVMKEEKKSKNHSILQTYCKALGCNGE
jgi:hypothetical protein